MKNNKIHLYALCFNEARMLPFFFSHYDEIVDRYFIFDNGSTDSSYKILSEHPKVELSSIQFSGNSFVIAAQIFYNSFWKESRGQADWVIVCNIDEHLYHENFHEYLDECSSNGYTLLKPIGFNMISQNFPNYGQPLYKQVQIGVRDARFDKLQLFQPDEIDEINFTPGRHRANPRGNVRLPFQPELKLLHYKYLGQDYFSTRLAELRVRLRDVDVIRKYGEHYQRSEQQKKNEFQRILDSAVQVL